jgi:hypothetical protein
MCIEEDRRGLTLALSCFTEEGLQEINLLAL